MRYKRFSRHNRKDVLHYLLKGTQPIILALARGLKKKIEPEFQKPLSDNRLLIISPFNQGVNRVSEKTAFSRNKIPPQKAFQEFTQYFDYQLIVYLFFINNKDQFLSISQKIFDQIISDKLHIPDFKTSGNISWENYKTFIEIIKEVHRFLRTKDKNAEPLDAHSFLWIMGKQREAWLNEQNSNRPNSATRLSYPGQKAFDIESETSSPSSVNEYNDQNSTKSDSENAAAKNRKNIFTPADITWVKNVTGYTVGQAYMELDGEQLNSFVLLFPDQAGNNIKSPQVGEIILLRQYVNGTSAFTHLVSPIDDELVEENIHKILLFIQNKNRQLINPFTKILHKI